MQQAIIYTRVSSEQQVEGTSIDTQEDRCRDAAVRFGLEVAGVEVDAGVSAKSLVGRDGLARAVAKVKRIHGALIVYKFDRLARNTKDAATVRESLIASGCRVISATEGEAETSPISKMMFTLLSAFAELDNDMRAERCRGGMVARAQEGCWVTHPPAGFRVVKVGRRPLLEPDGEKSPWIARAFLGLADGTLTPLQAEKLLEEHIAVCRSLAWRILRMPVYGGYIQSKLTDGKRIRAAFDGLVPPETWEMAQKRFDGIDRKDKPHKMLNPEFPLAGVLVCPVCGAPVRGGNVGGRNGKYAYYFCSKRGHINVRAEIVHGSVDAHLRCLGSSESFLVACREEVRKHAAEEAKADAEERAAKTRKLTAAENRLRRAREALLDGTLTREEYEAEKRARRTEIAGLSVDLENTAERIALREQVCNGLIEFVHNCTGLMARVDPSDAQMLVRYLFGAATLTKKGIEPTQNSLYQKIKALETSAFANGGPAMPIVEIMARFLAVSDRIKALRNLVDNCA